MSKQSAFDRDTLNTIDIESRDVLEELHLPPQLAAFIRKNAKNLQIALSCLLLLILAWTGIDYYLEGKRQESTALLAQAMKNTETDRSAQLEQVISQYSGSDAALWAQLELGHLAFNNGNFTEAANKYSAILADLSSDNPLVPLVRFSLARTYENNASYDLALELYQELVKTPGFTGEGHLGLGRIYEQKKDTAKAKEYYRLFLNDEKTPAGSTKTMIESKLSSL